MPWAASITALSPEPQTLLMVRAATLAGSPPRMAACRAGAWPGRHHVAEDNLVHPLGRQPGPGHGLADHQGPQRRGGEALQGPEQLSGGKADGGENDGFAHDGSFRRTARTGGSTGRRSSGTG